MANALIALGLFLLFMRTFLTLVALIIGMLSTGFLGGIFIAIVSWLVISIVSFASTIVGALLQE